VAAVYVFLKYAKLYEHEQFKKYGNHLLPDDAPPLPHAYKQKDKV
jgi:hypothetical protein